ncbi:MAG: MarR family winged helix-turn-helix transcriptional regulator [Clostridia bacterium]
MSDSKLEQIVERLIIIIPLLKRKLLKAEPLNKKSDLNPSHHQILFMLDDIGAQSISETIRNLSIKKTNITPLVEKLVTKGYIDRIHNQSDRRFINIDLTPAGKAYIEDTKDLLANSLKGKISCLSDEDLDSLLSSMENIKDILTKI